MTATCFLYALALVSHSWCVSAAVTAVSPGCAHNSSASCAFVWHLLTASLSAASFFFACSFPVSLVSVLSPFHVIFGFPPWPLSAVIVQRPPAHGTPAGGSPAFVSAPGPSVRTHDFVPPPPKKVAPLPSLSQPLSNFFSALVSVSSVASSNFPVWLYSTHCASAALLLSCTFAPDGMHPLPVLTVV
ncbi:hypothetical protein, conserved in T. vivax [Trypanosoma vivax Y486]|uniref:Uncharacterized protein n=1 Tax=Trypanosoma vivax (strain Y486) TaxID=1055687 RepID=F9WLW6_TRYVY|nr:hypothetical protein, conserved in T. vivax [Trypanosoma vivax Y486]|eukprot:CCD18510.1 hypothetical protein, conserved in T. vivax [Trypanosoma vivax Y486]